MIGEEKFEEEVKLLEQMKEEDKKKSGFQAMEGDVDNRDDKLKDKELSQGFKTQCGIRGGKLSGGQK